jgi:hypothetical protein
MKPAAFRLSQRTSLLPVVVLIAAALACNQTGPTPVALTASASSSTPGPTLLPSATLKVTATQPLVAPATVDGTAGPLETSSPVPGADCDNTYLPTSQGSTWKYVSTSSVTSGSGGRTVTTTKVGKDSFFHNVQLLKPPIHYEVSWQCTAQGLVEYGGGVLASLNVSGKVKITILKNTGVSLPRSLGIGDTWSQTTEIQMTSDTLNGTGRWIGNFKAVGLEPVTVPAGAFNALRIDGTLKSESDPYPSLNLTVEGTSWYAPQVGLVKNAGHIFGETADYTYELNLVAYSIP